MASSREFPAHPIAAVGAVIWKGDEVLLVRQKKPPRDQIWGLPGGAQDLGETIDAALHREVAEETGLSIAVTGLVEPVDAIFKDDRGRVQYHYTVLDYRCEWLAGEVKPSDDVAEARWVKLEDLDNLKMWEMTRDVIRRSILIAK
ncbi:MAG: NUDIX domain-containing protein [Alphaproteobacteria bacterium]|nr:MAG: NUDIX domain-containing protein [Alphaproteobacteria bacterium]